MKSLVKRKTLRGRPGIIARKPRFASKGLPTAKLRNRAIHGINILPPGKLKIAAEFITYLGYNASDEATAELLSIPGLLDDVRKAHEEISAGKAMPWRKVLRNV